MRIIAGKYKGKVLKEFELSSTRPTADMVREALFDKIGIAVCDKVFLDLFAGTGAVGIEALSRGAKYCYFVDNQKMATIIEKKNVDLVKGTNCEILTKNFDCAIDYFKNNNIIFDFVFIDPPYATELAENAIRLLNEKKLLATNGLIVWEHDNSKIEFVKNNFPNSITKKYGKKYLTYIGKDCL